ncbi:MAG: hypothetical protein ACK55J_01785 [Alphaproteobacteria bacterium]
MSATLPTPKGRAAEGSQHRQMAAMVGIPQWQAEQPALPVAHMKFGTAACFKQGNAGESGFRRFNATVGLHGFFAPQNHACCDALKESPSLVVEQLTGMVSR